VISTRILRYSLMRPPRIECSHFASSPSRMFNETRNCAYGYPPNIHSSPRCHPCRSIRHHSHLSPNPLESFCLGHSQVARPRVSVFYFGKTRWRETFEHEQSRNLYNYAPNLSLDYRDYALRDRNRPRSSSRNGPRHRRRSRERT